MYLHDAELLPHLDELDTAQRLGENVGKMAVGTDVIDLHLAIFNTLTNEVVLHVNVLGPFMVH
jgi:hypothetical protein